jgi:hypothetical protein
VTGRLDGESYARAALTYPYKPDKDTGSTAGRSARRGKWILRHCDLAPDRLNGW